MTLKEELHALIDRLPDDASIEDVQYRLYVLDKIKRGEESIKRGETLTQAEVEARFAKWLSK
jgi:predicted transcriptional regulator